MSYVDLNRCGVALMEIVSKPDMRSPAEAGAYLRKLRAILRYVGSCDGNMEEGSMRADVNVSVRKPGGELGTRTETKNVNSVRFVMAVIEGEAKRQVELIESGGAVAQETRLYDPDKNVTRSLRSKEDAHDYRYFPDPDLLPLELDDALNRLGRSIDDSPVTPAHAAELLGLVGDGTISGTISKKVFEILLETGGSPAEIVEREGLKQTSDTGEIDGRIDEILAANAEKVEQYQAGKEALFGFFVGQVMKAMQGKANPGVVNQRLKAKLAN